MCYFALPPTICECPFPHPSKRQHLKDFYKNTLGPLIFFSNQVQVSFSGYHLFFFSFLFVDGNLVSHLLFHLYQFSKEGLSKWGKGIIKWTDLKSGLPWIPVYLITLNMSLTFSKGLFPQLWIRDYSAFALPFLQGDFKGQMRHLWRVYLNILCLIANYCHLVKISEHISILIF